MRQGQIAGLDEVGKRVHLFDVVLKRTDSLSEALETFRRLDVAVKQSSN